MSRPRLTVRARLTLLYTGLFTVCGAIVVAVSYAQVARLPTLGQRNGQQPPSAVGIEALCRSEQPSAHVDKQLIVQCVSYLQRQGAQSQRDLTVSHLLQYSLITLAVVIVLAAVLGWIFSGRALRPVQQIAAAARAASEHNLSARVAPRGPRDELRELAETFDEMLGRLQAAFEGQQRFIANASHELRTPLAVMGTTVDVVLDNPESTPGDLRGMAADIRAAVDHAEHLIGALLILARNERGLTVREEVDLATAAEDVLDIAGLGDRRVHATLDPAVISGDPVLAGRLIANLVDNAVRYNIAAGDIWVSTRTTAGSSRLTVANTGPVISPADVGRIFQPFQRLSDRTSHDGFGLGLAIVASIAAIHGGTATARPRDGGGLSVTVTIPSADAPAQGTGIQSTERPGVPRPGLRMSDSYPDTGSQQVTRSSFPSVPARGIRGGTHDWVSFAADRPRRQISWLRLICGLPVRYATRIAGPVLPPAPPARQGLRFVPGFRCYVSVPKLGGFSACCLPGMWFSSRVQRRRPLRAGLPARFAPFARHHPSVAACRRRDGRARSRDRARYGALDCAIGLAAAGVRDSGFPDNPDRTADPAVSRCSLVFRAYRSCAIMIPPAPAFYAPPGVFREGRGARYIRYVAAGRGFDCSLRCYSAANCNQIGAGAARGRRGPWPGMRDGEK